jgi:Raf kinase inhibitor-like YbhB/YbcL family protein
MKTPVLFVCVLFVVAAAPRLDAQISAVDVMQIDSPDFPEGGNIPARFTCEGQNINPGLRFTGVPPTAKSLALLVDDPDAPAGTFNHWIVWNLKPNLKEILAGSAPQDAVQGKNDGGATGYTGPCPPSGNHRYYFRIYALDLQLKLGPGAGRKAFDAAIKGHVLKNATLMGHYAKSGGTR